MLLPYCSDENRKPVMFLETRLIILTRYNKRMFTIVIYPSNPDSCRAESQYWSLFQCSLCHHGAAEGWCRSGSLLWFPRHRSLNKRSSSTMLCNSHQLQKSNVSWRLVLGRGKAKARPAVKFFVKWGDAVTTRMTVLKKQKTQ